MLAGVSLIPGRRIQKVSEVSAPPSIVPKDTDRPCYRVLDDPHHEGDAKYPGWRLVLRNPRPARARHRRHWCGNGFAAPIHIDAVTTDPSAGNYGRLLRFKTTLGSWRTWAMPMDLLRGDCSDLRGELLSMGVEIDPHGRNMLASFLQAIVPKRKIQCALQAG